MKPKILYINTVSGYASTGKIIGDLCNTDEYDSLVCFGRKKDYLNINAYKFANLIDNVFGALGTILFDNNLNICSLATKRLIKKIKEYNPDIIHLHNLHGYYLNVEMLFNFLKEYNKPVVWTLHDCWSATGYCCAIGLIDCTKYQTKCENCECGFTYPYSLFKQNLQNDYIRKAELFTSLNNLTLVTPSIWLSKVIKSSKLSKNKVVVINNGINLEKFSKSKEKNKVFTVLAVASQWSNDKGPEELQKIIDSLDKDIEVIVIGDGSSMFKNCKTMSRTANIQELVDLYSSSHVLVNPTLDENFPTVNIESLACGTPVITYNTGGSSEIIDEKTGIVIEKRNSKSMAETINKLKNEYYFSSDDCINRSRMYSKKNMIDKYRDLYLSILNEFKA